MSTIPASELVAVPPSVLAAGGTGLDLIGLVLTTNTRVPINGNALPTVKSFPDLPSVNSFFGATSQEASIAGTYFSGFEGASKIPGSILFAQYPTAAVSAYLRGGNISALTLAQLQAFNATLNVTIDGVLKTASVNLAAATSFSNAAEIIANDLGIAGVPVGTVTGSIGGTATTCTTTGTTLTLGALATGKFQAGDVLTANDGSGHTLVAQTIVAQLTGTPGGSAGATFQMSAAATGGDLTSTTVTAKGTTLTVTALGTAPAVGIADTIAGTGIAAGTYVTAQVTPLITGEALGGIGRYAINAAQAGVVISETITLDTPAVQYDSVSGAFVILSGTTGAASTITFGTGAMAVDLLLTAATGAVTSQGADAPTSPTPAAYMNALVAANANWATFMTAFDPDASGNTAKQAFAAWKNTQNNRYAYVCWDVDVTPTTTLPATSSIGYLLANNNDSGTCLLDGDPAAGWNATSGPNLAAFVCGAGASIDFTETDGRITFAYKAQAGLVGTVVNGTVATNLGGNPQSAGSRGNGYNFYGAYGSANDNFIWFQRGFVTGKYAWLDSFLNQIWMNNGLQGALLAYEGSAKSIPFNLDGAAGIRSALADQIKAGLDFGAYAPGTISASQAAQVNAAAGVNIAGTLQTQGWFLLVQQQSSVVRANRGPWSITFFYLDRGSVQSISLSSVAVL